MELTIDRTSAVPIYRQIVRQVRGMILGGTLPDGFRLPPERRLAQALGINRSTVVTAYDELRADGLVDAHVGRGTVVVRQAQPVVAAPIGGELPWPQLFREEASRAQDPLVRDLLALTERDDVISLAIGLPSPELLPLDHFTSILGELTSETGPALMLHCPTEGLSALRETLAGWLAARGIPCSPAEVLILSGSQQGLDLAARALVEPGDTVVVEEPSYFGALQVFRSAKARLVGVPIDEEGMRTDILARVLERVRPKLVYTLPTFQNPSGAVMSLPRRRELLALAARHGVPILEDDPYSELRYEGTMVPSLKALDSGESVLHLGTFSKILFPGLRLGWLVAPRPVVRRLALLKQAMDLHSNTPGQYVLERFIRRSLINEHLHLLRRAYTQRRNAMEEALRRHAGAGVTWQKPAGGFYFWCRLPDGVERSRLMAQAAERGVAFLPGWACFAEEPGESCVRLNFSYPPPHQLAAGVDRLMAAVRAALVPAGRRLAAAAGTRPIV